MNQEIPIFYVSAGSGHKIAARALEHACLTQSIKAKAIDLMDDCNRAFYFRQGKLYDWLCEHSHAILKLGYSMTDKNRYENKLVQRLDKKDFDEVYGIQKYVQENDPKLVVCTHFIPPTILGRLRQEGLFHGKIHVVVTDFGLHKLWFHKEVDRYYVANDKVKDALIDLGVPKEKIVVSGIPIEEKFQHLRRKFTPKKRKTVLFVASAIKDKKAIKIIKKLLKAEFALNIKIIAGRNDSLFEKLEPFTSNKWVHIEKFGFVSDIETHMLAADLMLSKPGGLTVSEALAVAIPMVMIYPIPYQEIHNALFMEKIQAGIMGASKSSMIVEQVLSLLQDDAYLEKMTNSALAYGKPYAAEEITQTLKQYYR